MIVMLHKMEFYLEGTEYEGQMSMAVEGQDQLITGMAQTVGLPLGIATKLILTDKIDRRGVLIPITDDFYEPILNELEEDHGIRFVHEMKVMADG